MKQSFYTGQELLLHHRGKGFKRGENNLVFFKCNRGLSAKLKCLKNRTTTYVSLEKGLAERRIVFTEQYQHGNSTILKKDNGEAVNKKLIAREEAIYLP